MSALGEYIHLRKYNYNLYGLQRSNNSTQEEHNLNDQIAIWNHKLNNVRIQMHAAATKDDQVLDYLNGDTVALKQFMLDLEEAKTQEYTDLKEQILQDVLGKEWKQLVEFIRIDFSTGAVSTSFTKNEATSIFSGDDMLNIFKRLGQNQGQIWFSKDEYDIGDRIIQILKQCIQECRKYFDEVFGKKDSNFTNSQIKKYKATVEPIGNELKLAESLIKSAEEKEDIYKMVKAKINPKRTVTDKTKAYYLNTDFDLKYSAQHLVNIIEAMKVPNLNNIKGAIMEHLERAFIESGRSIAFDLATKTLGNLETQGIIQSFKISPEAAKFLKSEGSEKQKYHLKIDKTKDKANKDKIIDAGLEYTYSSQRKADVRLSVKVAPTELGLPDIGISVKNYATNQIHLVSGASLLTFLFGDNTLSIDEGNHFLNILTESYGDTKAPENTKDKAKAQALSNIATPLNIARRSVLDYTKMMILYKAATGKGLGKDASNNAEYILLNQPNKLDGPFFVSIARLVDQMSTQINKITVRMSNGKNSGSTKIEDYRLSNEYVSAPGNDIQARQNAIAQRIAKVLSQLHQTKLSVAIAAGQLREAAGLSKH